MADSADKGKAPAIAAPGRFPVEYAVVQDGSMPAWDYIQGLLKIVESAETDILARFSHVAQNGEVNVSENIFKHERDEIWAFKYKIRGDHHRLPCFRYKNRWFVTHGFKKIRSKSKWPEQEFRRANEIRKWVIATEKSKES
jgi:hypothetical protein